MKKVVIITGASQGIGFELAKFLSDKNYTVYGISRSPFNLMGVIHLKGDVTNEDLMDELINDVYLKEGQIDLLINNAGMGISGSIEGTKLEDVKKIFEVNFYGIFITTKAVLPIMRKQGYGKIVNIGSVAGEFAIPFQSFYSSTKASIRVFTEALANEVKPYGIQASVILPGDIKTNFTKNRSKNKSEVEIYQRRVDMSVAQMEKDEQEGMSVSYATKVIYKVIKRKKMPLVKTIGTKYKVLQSLKRVLPSPLVNYLIGKIYGYQKE